MADQRPAAHEWESGGASEQRLRELAHDLRHCLFTLRTEIQLLRQAEHEPAHLEEILASMDNDQRRAAELFEELLTLVRRPETR